MVAVCSQIYLQPCVTLTFDLLTPKVDHFMHLPQQQYFQTIFSTSILVHSMWCILNLFSTVSIREQKLTSTEHIISLQVGSSSIRMHWPYCEHCPVHTTVCHPVMSLVFLTLIICTLLCPRPRRGGGGIRRSSASVVCPSVRLSVWCRVHRL